LLEFLRTNALDGGSDNTPLRKGKKSIYEGGARVPSVLYWKGQISPARSTQMITVRDVLPTVLAAANVPAANGAEGAAAIFHGTNQWLGMTVGARGQAPDYLINSADGEALYRYPWKLLALKSGDVELYQLDNDPTESVDYPRGESVHVPLWRSMMDIDFFGGEEDRAPWSEIDGD
jgi:arylsulfatase A-like enzyme